ncbi:WXG100 family type VII secretion target [Oliverpabstia intestinalis]|uniref:WXG100 family type VII secretion target n=1 Tax=Oliverpabstia intestinalis TaxID=2606633 RepID=UPI003F8A5CEA
MAKFQVTTAELKAAIADLQEKNGTFLTKVNELEQAQQALRAQWQGDANTAFNTAFENDKAQWMNFSKLITQYIQALQTIMETYEKAEAANTTTATNRSY